MSGTAPYYTQAFSNLPGRCSAGAGGGGRRPDPLLGAARLGGPFHTPNATGYRVEACEGHRPR